MDRIIKRFPQILLILLILSKNNSRVLILFIIAIGAVCGLKCNHEANEAHEANVAHAF